jgi:hypothetical protein
MSLPTGETELTAGSGDRAHDTLSSWPDIVKSG